MKGPGRPALTQRHGFKKPPGSCKHSHTHGQGGSLYVHPESATSRQGLSTSLRGRGRCLPLSGWLWVRLVRSTAREGAPWMEEAVDTSNCTRPHVPTWCWSRRGVHSFVCGPDSGLRTQGSRCCPDAVLPCGPCGAEPAPSSGLRIGWALHPPGGRIRG